MENTRVLPESILSASLDITSMASSPWEIALLGTIAVSWLALLLALVGLWRAQTQSGKIHRVVLQLSKELSIANNGAAGMGQRIIKLEKKLVGLTAGGSDVFSAADPMIKSTSRTEDRGLGETVIKPVSSARKEENISSPSTLVGMEKQTVSLKVQGKTKALAKVTVNPTPSLAVVSSSADSEKKQITADSKAPTAEVDGIQETRAFSPFELAEKLLLQGVEPDEVAKRCGLSESEAELMAMVQNKRINAAG